MLEEHARKQRVAIHAYVLMSNHFHLLATPETAEGIPQMMQAVGRRYVRNFNLRQARTGTLWEGRYKSTLIQAERYLLACMVYMDLNPVRRAWSRIRPTTRGRATSITSAGARDKLGTPHPLYWELGNTPFAATQAYAELVRQGFPQDAAAGADGLGLARLGAGRARLRGRPAAADGTAASEPRSQAGSARLYRRRQFDLSPIRDDETHRARLIGI